MRESAGSIEPTSGQFNLPLNDLGGLAAHHRDNLLLRDCANQRIGIMKTIVGLTLKPR
ncbi:MAG TPA: hypothetical protein VGS96_03900 [Thermoanaerobaculia bacterium]|jgi:hypothetical protein|nr:hypothetical protein [Thermoanaerobaculia bacterium]